MPARSSAERKVSDTVQIGLRIREELRRQLADEAQLHKISINREMANRLERSFDAGARQTLKEIATDMARAWGRLRKASA